MNVSLKKKKSIYREPLSKKPVFWILAIFIGSWVAFGPVVHNGHLNWDDIDYITNNPTIKILDFSHIKDIFTSHPLKTYVPLTVLSFAFEYFFFQLNFYFYHLDNLFLHIAVASLLYLFLRKLKLSVRGAGLASVLFAIHPTHVEAVAWLSARKDVLYAFFYLLALLNYCWYLEKGRTTHYWLSFFFGFLSMLAKSMALSLPFILLLCDWAYQRKYDKKMILDKLPYFVFILPLAWVNFIPNTSSMNVNQNGWEAFLIFIWSMTFYIKAFVFPFNLIPLYQTPEPINLFNPIYLLSVSILFICGAIIYRYRKSQWLIFAFAFYFCSIFFLLRFDRLYNLSVVADRYMYLPMIGFCLLVGFVLNRFWSWVEEDQPQFKPFLVIGLLAVCMVLVLKTNIQSRIWRTNLSLWNYTIPRSPNLSVAYLNRGAAYQDAKQIQESKNDFIKSSQLLPSFGAYFNLAKIYADEKEYILALSNYNEAIRLDSQQPLAFNNRGVIHSNLKNYAQAVKDFIKAIELDPTLFDSYYNKAVSYSYLGNFDEALQSYNQVIQMQPDFWEAYANRAVIYTKLKRLDLALKDYDYYLRFKPQSASSYIERSRVHADLKAFNSALKDALTAKQLGYAVDEQYIEEMKQLVQIQSSPAKNEDKPNPPNI